MEVTIDALGRILIPKKLRDILGLNPRSTLNVTIEEGGIRLEPKVRKAELVETESGALVIRGLSPVTHEQMEELKLAAYEHRFRSDCGK